MITAKFNANDKQKKIRNGNSFLSYFTLTACNTDPYSVMLCSKSILNMQTVCTVLL